VTDESRIVERDRAASGLVSYTSPIVIRGGPKKTTYFDVLLQYIRHDHGPDQVAAKVSYWKKKSGQFRSGFPAEFTLDQDEVKALRDVLDQGLAVAGASSDGAYLLIPLVGGTAVNLTGRDPVAVGRALTALLSSDQVIPALQSDPEGSRLLRNLRGAVQTGDLEAAIAELDENLDDGIADEATYQRWCESHSWAFGNVYTMRDEVRSIALGDQVDLLLEATASGLRDIFELKRPDKDVIRYDDSHRSWYWSAASSQAIGQCHRYLDALHEGAASGLRDHPEVVAYHPRGVIVIGRSNGWGSAEFRALHGLNARLHGISLMTYDQLRAQAAQHLSVIQR
jgi:hypothetical protein